MHIPNILLALALMFFGIAGGFVIMLAAARHIEYLIQVSLSLVFGKWIVDEYTIKTLMRCGYLTIVLLNVTAFLGLMVYEILF